MRCSLLTFLFLLLAIPATCFSWSAKVISVVDGDTDCGYTQVVTEE